MHDGQCLNFGMRFSWWITYRLSRKHEQTQKNPSEKESSRDDKQTPRCQEDRGAHSLPAGGHVELPFRQAGCVFRDEIHCAFSFPSI